MLLFLPNTMLLRYIHGDTQRRSSFTLASTLYSIICISHIVIHSLIHKCWNFVPYLYPKQHSYENPDICPFINLYEGFMKIHTLENHWVGGISTFKFIRHFEITVLHLFVFLPASGPRFVSALIPFICC